MLYRLNISGRVFCGCLIRQKTGFKRFLTGFDSVRGNSHLAFTRVSNTCQNVGPNVGTHCLPIRGRESV